MLESVRDRRVLITGAGSGIGLSIAARFLEAGAIVGANILPDDDRGRESLQALSRLGTLEIVPGDVSKGEEISSAIEGFASRFGPIEVLASNAGIGNKAPFLELTDEAWQQMMAVHLGGAINTTRACLPGMLEQGFGRIIYTASELVPIGLANLSHYCAAKGAIVSMARALAREVGPQGVTVNCVAPGPTVTPMFVKASDEYNEQARLTIPLQSFGDPDNVAWSWLFLASEAGRWYTGQFVSPNGGVTM
ncbi:MAG: SDR family NAD(P)-dependent oxidoreductase [Solirubrobacteraceae bacterium]|jgi:3-oxoacyl-[acyl-carrier protein] reductase